MKILTAFFYPIPSTRSFFFGEKWENASKDKCIGFPERKRTDIIIAFFFGCQSMNLLVHFSVISVFFFTLPVDAMWFFIWMRTVSLYCIVDVHHIVRSSDALNWIFVKAIFLTFLFLISLKQRSIYFSHAIKFSNRDGKSAEKEPELTMNGKCRMFWCFVSNC